jgi:flagellar biosynthesis/type III secretory pathway protein FliH
MSEPRPVIARRLSLGEVVQGQGRALERDGGDAAVPSADLKEYRLGFERGYTDGLQQARTEAEAAIAQARTEWERQAQAALDKAQADLLRSRERLDGVAGALAEALREDRRWAESTAVEMAYAAVLRVFGDKAVERSLVVELCAQARRETGGDVVGVRVAPADADAMHAAFPGLSVVADDSLPPGSCVLDSRRGRFDAGLEARLDHLREALLAALYQKGSAQEGPRQEGLRQESPRQQGPRA